MLSTALAVFLGFRNSQVYDRWWEARQLWGTLVNYSRSFARQLLTFTAGKDLASHAQVKSMIYRHIAFVYALKAHLRLQPQTEFTQFLDAEGQTLAKGKDNLPNYLLLLQSRELAELKNESGLPDMLFVQIDQALVQFHQVQGGCERIKNTPFPRQYNYFTKLFVHLHGLLLPFAFVKDLWLLTIPVSVALSFVFMSLDKISTRLENPFENRINDVPMNAISRTIEINLKEMLQEEKLPEKIGPVDGFLF
ncbi:MAG TPA: bestrophin family ion channel, partial [Flavisolibacter sp.]|nr:bestrophin family ion channel [Flavisolibacter sp.]